MSSNEVGTEITNFFLNVAGSIVGGILVAAATWLLGRYQRWFRNIRFKSIFGIDADKSRKFFIVYGKLRLRKNLVEQNGKFADFQFFKPPRPPCDELGKFRASNPVSDSELRAANYLATSFGNNVGLQPTIKSDEDIESSDAAMDLSFVSLGGLSNWKSLDVLNNDHNDLIEFNEGRFVSKKNQMLAHDLRGQFDYGLILKIHPNVFPKRVWIACIGYGEWGTSGSAYFLGNKWKELSWKKFIWYKPWSLFSNKDFAAIVRVNVGQDQSATLIEYYRTSQDVEKRAQELQESGAIDNSELEPHLPSSAASTLSSAASAASVPTTITINLSQNEK